jgi:hypothetical protein
LRAAPATLPAVRWAGILLLAGCAAARAGEGSPPLQDAVGCYVALQIRQIQGPAVDLMFPGFFALDTVAVDDAAVPGRQVLLPRDDLSRRAGSWSWIEHHDSLVVKAITATQGWRLALSRAGSDWEGSLTGWEDSVSMVWTLTGRRVNCPAGLVPAAH